MAFQKGSITYNQFFGGMSNDDKLTGKSQVLYAENLDLKRNSDYCTLNRVSSRVLLTNSKQMNGFVNCTNASGSKRTLAYGEDGDIYNIALASDNTPTNTTLTSDLINAIEFNDQIRFVPFTGAVAFSLQRTDSANAYAGTFSFTAVASGLNGGTQYKYPMYNDLEAFLYVGIGKDIIKISSETDLVDSTFNIGTENIVSITKLGGIFKLYQEDGRIIYWDGFSDGIDSTVNIDDELRVVHSHRGIDYGIGGPSGFYSNFYFMNGYEADLIESGIDSEIPQSPQSDRSSKFYIKGGINQVISFDGQIHVINEDSKDSIHSFGNKRIGLPKGFENIFYLSPDGNQFENIYALGYTTSRNSFYYSYNDGVNHAIGQYDPTSGNPLTTGSIILPVFDAGSNTTKKKIEKIYINGENVSANSKLTLKTGIDGAALSNSTDITSSGRTRIFDIKDEFYEMFIQIDFTIVTGTTNPRLKEVKLFYTIIED